MQSHQESACPKSWAKGKKETGVGLGCVYPDFWFQSSNSGLWEFLWVLGLPGLGHNMGVQLGLLLGSSSELRMLPVSHLAVLPG